MNKLKELKIKTSSQKKSISIDLSESELASLEDFAKNNQMQVGDLVKLAISEQVADIELIEQLNQIKNEAKDTDYLSHDEFWRNVGN